jgi:hypothetical protein
LAQSQVPAPRRENSFGGPAKVPAKEPRERLIVDYYRQDLLPTELLVGEFGITEPGSCPGPIGGAEEVAPQPVEAPANQ